MARVGGGAGRGHGVPFWGDGNVLELDNGTIPLNCSCLKGEFYDMGIVSHQNKQNALNILRMQDLLSSLPIINEHLESKRNPKTCQQSYR